MSEKTMNIFKKIPLIMAEVGHIDKTRTNNAQGYKFRGIDDLYSALQAPLSRHGVFFSPEVLSNSREERQTKTGGNLIYTVLSVKYTFYADDGSSFSCVTVGEAMDSGDKSANKAMSAALKYALLQLFCVPTEEDNDTENNTHAVIPKPKDRPVGFVAPNDPVALGDGFAPEGYRITFGKWKNRSLEEVYRNEGPEEIANYISYLEKEAEKKKKPITGVVLEFMLRATEFLGKMENSGPNFNDP